MDYLQYLYVRFDKGAPPLGFKPYYKWITFNTIAILIFVDVMFRFKPYYKWITFNTKKWKIF